MAKKYLKRSRKPWIIIIPLLAVILLITICFLAKPEPAHTPTVTEPVSDSSTPTEEVQEDLRLPDLLGTAKAIKSNLVSALADLKQGKLDNARNKLEDARKDISAVHRFADNSPLLLGLIPQSDKIINLLDVGEMAIADIVMPVVDLLEAYPISGFSVGDGFNVRLIGKYLDFAESIMPKLERLTDALQSVNLSLLDSEGKIDELLKPVNKLLDLYHKDPAVFSVMKSMLGVHEDRLYLIAVQNPSELRASGGFPGFMGMLRIQDGILTVGDFQSVTNVLTFYTPSNVVLTQEEWELFTYLAGMNAPRDADLCPNFERVAEIWNISYETRHKHPLSGVISVTPHVVQRLLAATGDEIELSDGWTLNGENAIQVLLHDVYFKYFNRRNPHPYATTISDQVFEEAAEGTMKRITSDISVSKLMSYIPVAEESIADRTLMFWMKDEKEQALVKHMGWSGGLNHDPQKPEAGVYVNVVNASKMGWFLLMDTKMGRPAKNADGSYTYPVTVTFDNNITNEEISMAGSYIAGHSGGAMVGVAYFFAPAGGKVDHFKTSIDQDIKIKTYNGLELGFMDQFVIYPNTPITVTYTITTAPGVDTPPEFSKTPTAQQPE